MSIRQFSLALAASLAMTGCLDEGAAPDEPSADETSQVESNIVRDWLVITNKQFASYLHLANTASAVDLTFTASDHTDWYNDLVAGTTSTYQIRAYYNGFCMGVGSTASGAPATMTPCTASTNQQWVRTLRSVGGVSYYFYRNVFSNLCLDANGSATSQVVQHACGATNDSESWRIWH